MLTVGTPAPNFTLPDQDGTVHSLSEEKGRWVLIYFYPKDDTPGCTTEACGFQDEMVKLKKHDVVIFGVSADSVEKHAKFAQKFSLSFPLLSDADKTMIEAYGAWGEKSFMGKNYMGILRISYLIAPDGKIAKVYEKVKVEDHPAEVLRDLDVLAK
ncbi:MAG: thioredoxin-dependent thiol peroxidase [Candidatus Peribacteraceae bacterium]|nr:thioredoxin-dependent thiol peroxidase [Candidatus Peribacteraceae bacterium]